MAYMLLAFAAVFLLIASGGLLLFYRETMSERVAAVITPNQKKETLMGKVRQTGTSLSGVFGQFQKVSAAKPRLTIFTAPRFWFP